MKETDLPLIHPLTEQERTGPRNWWVLWLVGALVFLSLVLYTPGMP